MHIAPNFAVTECVSYPLLGCSWAEQRVVPWRARPFRFGRIGIHPRACRDWGVIGSIISRVVGDKGGNPADLVISESDVRQSS